MLKAMYQLLDAVGIVWYTIIMFALLVLLVNMIVWFTWSVIPSIINKWKERKNRNLQLNNTLLYAYNEYKRYGGKKGIIGFKNMIQRINWSTIEQYDETPHDYPSQVIACKNKIKSEEMIKNG